MPLRHSSLSSRELDMSVTQRGQAGCSFPLDDLPESCVAEVLAHLSPRDVGRLSCLNRTWAAAAASSTVWKALVPDVQRELCDRVYGPGTLKQQTKLSQWALCYQALRRGIFLQKGRQCLHVHPQTGALRLSVSSGKAMEITWSRYRVGHEEWAKTAARGACSPFMRSGDMAVLHWVNLKCKVVCILPAGTYSVAWRLSREFLPGDDECYELTPPGSPTEAPEISCDLNTPGGGKAWSTTPARSPPRAGRMGLPFLCFDVPARSKISVSGRKPMSCAVPISQQTLRALPEWTEFKVGEIRVEAHGGNQGLCQVELEAELTDTQRRKIAVYADALVLELQCFSGARQ